ncbi:MAG: Rieske (2Fe-2S) protein, partial [Bradymonadaceae bacterium]
GDVVRFDYETPLGRSVEGVALRISGEVIAFENVCPHLGLPLDCHTGEFLSDNGAVLLCDAHGARFEPESGRCTMGPC